MASKTLAPEESPSPTLMSRGGIQCRSAPDFFSLRIEEEGEKEYVQITEIKSRDFLNVAGEGGRCQTPPPQYSKVSERLRQIGSSSPTVHRFQCGTFCGGKGCKYENPRRWRKGETGVAFDGLFSHWITDNIVAMARPSTQLFTQYKLMEQFKESGVNAVVNLQSSGEHAHCGPQQENSGFTYKPEDLMKNNIYYYNYSLPDYGTCHVENILDVVKVIDFSCLNGRVAIHCHAGLGRTGAAIACYLVYSQRIGSEEAITKVREKRPDSIQTRNQIELVNQFSLLLLSLWNVYPTIPSSYTLTQYIERQSKLLHGEELEKYKHIPKVISVICNRIRELGETQSFQYHNSDHNTSNTIIITDDECEDTNSWLMVSVCSGSNDESNEICHYDESDHLIQSLLATCPCSRDKNLIKRLEIIKDEINSKWTWTELLQETDPTILFSLLFTYLSHLKDPMIQLTDCYNPNFLKCLTKCQKATLMNILETIKIVVPSSVLITYFSSIAVHLIKLFCHCSSEDIEDSEITCNHLLHYIMEYYQ